MTPNTIKRLVTVVMMVTGMGLVARPQTGGIGSAGATAPGGALAGGMVAGGAGTPGGVVAGGRGTPGGALAGGTGAPGSLAGGLHGADTIKEVSVATGWGSRADTVPRFNWHQDIAWKKPFPVQSFI